MLPAACSMEGQMSAQRADARSPAAQGSQGTDSQGTLAGRCVTDKAGRGALGQSAGAELPCPGSALPGRTLLKLERETEKLDSSGQDADGLQLLAGPLSAGPAGPARWQERPTPWADPACSQSLALCSGLGMPCCSRSSTNFPEPILQTGQTRLREAKSFA